MRFAAIQDFETWRAAARGFLNAEVPPEFIHWQKADEQATLFADSRAASEAALDRTPSQSRVQRVPAEFLSLAQFAAYHRNPQRWEILYRVLWRLTHGERQLLANSVDGDIHALEQMQKAVKRDEHKMHAFVRFRQVEQAGETRCIAWHRPDHHIVRLAAPFFARRFPEMNWSILTPDESAHWDGKELQFSPGVPASDAPANDALDELWRTYYANIFNPARVNVAQLKKEMPTRHWPTLPETRLIPELLQQARSRVATMVESVTGHAASAAQFIPPHADLATLAAAARGCTACELHCHATQTVFGVGPAQAAIVLVGEQPGDAEDLAGSPFVGPAGKLLDAALAAASLPREQVYLTNVVKHFKFTLAGKRRLHQKPGTREIAACRPWLTAELRAIEPRVVVCLGNTAAQAILGRDFRLTSGRGRILSSQFCPQTIASWHPAAILRMTDLGRREEMRDQLIHDLNLAKSVGE